MLYFLFLISFSVSADTSFKMGPGISDDGVSGRIKTFSLRQEDYLAYGLHQAAEGGFWVDKTNEGKSSGFGKYQLGVKPGPTEGIYAKAFIGIAGITHTDQKLGGHFQFSQDVGIGVRDKRSFVDLSYVHFSSAGIAKPNRGRDFLVFSVGLDL